MLVKCWTRPLKILFAWM